MREVHLSEAFVLGGVGKTGWPVFTTGPVHRIHIWWKEPSPLSIRLTSLTVYTRHSYDFPSVEGDQHASRMHYISSISARFIGFVLEACALQSQTIAIRTSTTRTYTLQIYYNGHG